MRKQAIAGAVALLLSALSGQQAFAQPVSPGDEAFDRGREALKVGKYDEACAAFEESQRLAPQLLTEFNIALCDEQLGKLATALAIHRELSTKDDNQARRAKSADLVEQLEARVPRLRIEVVQSQPPRALVPPGLEVTVEGVRATNFKDMPLDLGTSHVVARAPGFVEWRGEVSAREERQRVTVTITLTHDAAHATGPAEAAPTPGGVRETAPSSARRKLGVAAVIGGGFAIAGGVTFGLLARSKWHDAKAICGGTVCDTQDELDRGQALADEAQSRGRIATTLVVAGGVLAVAGAVLWATAPKAERALAVAPAAGPSSVGVTLLGRF